MSGDCRVLLIGMMGSGKSTIGELLSERTGWAYVDNDELVGRAHGTTARALQEDRGTDAMRAAEADALALGLALDPPAIVGVAAGVVLTEAHRRALDDGGIVVWLDAAPETLAARARDAEHRPWLDGDATTWMRETLAERAPMYRSVADLVLQTDGEPPAASAERLHRWLTADGRCPEAARA